MVSLILRNFSSLGFVATFFAKVKSVLKAVLTFASSSYSIKKREMSKMVIKYEQIVSLATVVRDMPSKLKTIVYLKFSINQFLKNFTNHKHVRF